MNALKFSYERSGQRISFDRVPGFCYTISHILQKNKVYVVMSLHAMIFIFDNFQGVFCVMAVDEFAGGRRAEIWRLSDGRNRMLVVGFCSRILGLVACLPTVRSVGRWTFALHPRLVLLACDHRRYVLRYQLCTIIYTNVHIMPTFNVQMYIFCSVPTGCGCLLAGIIISAVDWMYPHRFSTVIEVDYDTPYDRHVIIEESHDTRFKKRGSKDDHSLGSRILRYV